jgi:translation initiation factor 5
LLKCKACGFVSEVDARLRLCSFIVKNPPENKLSKAEKKVKKAEKERMKGLDDSGADIAPGSGEKKEKKEKKDKKKKDKKKKKGEEGADEENGDDDNDDNDDDDEEEDEEDEDDVVWMTDTSEEAMKKRAAEQLSKATAALVTQGNVEAEREAAKKREEKRLAEEAAAAKAKAEEEARLAAEAAALKLSDPAAALRAMLENGAKPGEVASEIKSIEGGPAARMKVLYTALFGSVPDSERVSSVLEDKEAYLTPHAGDPAGQLAQLVAMEHLLGVTLEGRAREAPLVLKALYDADLAEEDLIVAWFNKVDAGAVLGVPSEAAKAVRNAAKPFVEWLEEESDDEDDSEEEESEEEE